MRACRPTQVTTFWVLEAGRNDSFGDVFVHMPGGAAISHRKSFLRLEVRGRTRTAHARPAHLPRPREVPGGSSSINGMIFQHGNPMDYAPSGQPLLSRRVRGYRVGLAARPCTRRAPVCAVNSYEGSVMVSTLLVDNYDSFTYNLYALLAAVNGTEPAVIRNDSPWDAVDFDRFDNVVISPGPSTPTQTHDFGISARVIAETDRPLLGVCLGHQGLCSMWGRALSGRPNRCMGGCRRLCTPARACFADCPRRLSWCATTRWWSLTCPPNSRSPPARPTG